MKDSEWSRTHPQFHFEVDAEVRCDFDGNVQARGLFYNPAAMGFPPPERVSEITFHKGVYTLDATSLSGLFQGAVQVNLDDESKRAMATYSLEIEGHFPPQQAPPLPIPVDLNVSKLVLDPPSAA